MRRGGMRRGGMRRGDAQARHHDRRDVVAEGLPLDVHLVRARGRGRGRARGKAWDRGRVSLPLAKHAAARQGARVN